MFPLRTFSLAVSLACLGACRSHDNAAQPPASQPARELATKARAKSSAPRASVELPNVNVPDNLAWLAFGGGADPLSNQVSLAQDISLVRKVLARPGLVLFASGPGAYVAVARKPHKAGEAPVRERLARLFGPPDADSTDYQTTDLTIDGPATADHVRNALAAALHHGDSPLLVYAASHGTPGETAAQNSLSLWGGLSLDVEDVAALLDADAVRPSRFVITACFGGGFGDLIFRRGHSENGVRSGDHCGLFAAPWDDEASGCDPNPDRREQESYSIHFLHALAGTDRAENARSDIDLNGDGQIALLEAHTYARIHSRSFDVPTTTSERFLRQVAAEKDRAALDPLMAPEDVAVIKALGVELELDDEAAARAKLDELSRIMDDAEKAVSEAQKTSDEAYYALRIALLERYPLLEHPFEARAQALLRSEGRALRRFLDESELAEAHAHYEGELSEALSQHDTVRIARARVARLVRAFETLRLASVVQKRGGENLARYTALRSCERWVPPRR